NDNGRFRLGAGKTNGPDLNFYWKGFIKDPIFNLQNKAQTTKIHPTYLIRMANNGIDLIDAATGTPADNQGVVNGLQTIDGIEENVLYFDETTYYEFTAISLPQTFIFSCVFKYETIDNDNGALFDLQKGNEGGVTLHLENNSDLVLYTFDDGSPGYYPVTLLTDLSPETWYDCFLRIDSQTAAIRLSTISGETISNEVDISAHPYIAVSDGVFFLGRNGGGTHNFKGYMKQPACFNVVSQLKNVGNIATLNSVKNQRSWFTLNTTEERFLAIPLLDSSTTNQVLAAQYTSDNLLNLSYRGTVNKTADLPTYQYLRLSTNVVEQMLELVFAGGLTQFLQPSTQYLPEIDFTQYRGIAVEAPSSLMNFSGALGNYFWELFYHIPMYLARSLQLEKQYSEAQEWFNVIFDPMLNAADLAKIDTIEGRPATPTYAPMRAYLLFRPFQTPAIQSIYDTLESELEIAVYENDPYDPNALAALRPAAYAKATVMQYISNLIAYGDYLFTEDSWESINSATMYYTTAQRLLGNSPKEMPEDAIQPDKTYEDFITDNEDDNHLATFLVDMELEVPNNPPSVTGNSTVDTLIAQRRSMMSNYFCVPSNDQLETYRQTVSDRLYKIRNGLNINGQVNNIPLFQPPIDPEAAVQAAASGGAGAVSSLASPLNVSYYRFSYLIGVAKNFTAQVIQFGGELLSALEKQDAEHLSLLRENQSNVIQNMVTQMKEDQINQLYAQQSNLKANLTNAQGQQTTYQQWIAASWNKYESKQLLFIAQQLGQVSIAAADDLIASPLHLIPNIWGTADGGSSFGHSFEAAGKFYNSMGQIFGLVAQSSGIKGAFER
ncbi:MAG: hypothetical protein AAGJ18_23275, partial [Bacteroidota bacterium]